MKTRAQMARMVLKHADRVDERTLAPQLKSLVIAAWIIRHDEHHRTTGQGWAVYMNAELTLHLTPMSNTHTMGDNDETVV